MIEYLDTIVSVADTDISKTFLKILTKAGMKFFLGHKVTGGKNYGDYAEVTFEPVKPNGSSGPVTLKCDHVLVATGRRPFSDGLGAKELGIQFDNKNRISVNSHF